MGKRTRHQQKNEERPRPQRVELDILPLVMREKFEEPKPEPPKLNTYGADSMKIIYN